MVVAAAAVVVVVVMIVVSIIQCHSHWPSSVVCSFVPGTWFGLVAACSRRVAPVTTHSTLTQPFLRDSTASTMTMMTTTGLHQLLLLLLLRHRHRHRR